MVAILFFQAMAAPTIFDDVDKFSPDERPVEYPDGAFGMFENDEEKLDCKDEENEFPNPPMPPADPCMWGAPWDR